MKTSKSTIHIRAIDYPNDYASVLQVWLKSPPGVQISASDEPEEIRKKLQRDPDLFLIAENENHQIVGTVIGGYDGRRGMVYHLAVLPEYRNNHIGMSLMKVLEQRLRVKGCLKYYLFVTPDNLQTEGFYTQLGCERMDVTVFGKKL